MARNSPGSRLPRATLEWRAGGCSWRRDSGSQRKGRTIASVQTKGRSNGNGDTFRSTHVLEGTESTRLHRGRRRELAVLVEPVDPLPGVGRGLRTGFDDDIAHGSFDALAFGDVHESNLLGLFAELRFAQRGVQFGVGEGVRVEVAVR